MLLVGLMQPAATAALALSIAVFDWGPWEVAISASLLFGAGALMTPLGAAVVLLDLKQNRHRPWRPAQPLKRFSVRSLFVATTAVAVVVAALVAVDGEQSLVFAFYATAMTTVAVILAANFFWQYFLSPTAEPHAA
jgi:hypothetical protein